MFVTASIEVYGPALVAARPLARGERLNASLVKEQQAQINASRRGILTDPEQITDMLVRRPVNAGSLITPDLLQAPNAVERGDHVIITAKSGATITLRNAAAKACDHINGKSCIPSCFHGKLMKPPSKSKSPYVNSFVDFRMHV